MFWSDGQLLESRPRIFTESTGIPMNKLVTCPFCLKEDKLQLFWFLIRRGSATLRVSVQSVM